METKFYYCPTCKNIITKIEDKNMPVVCCEHNMKLMEPCTSDGAEEKHVPVIEQNGNKVTVKSGGDGTSDDQGTPDIMDCAQHG